MARPAMRKLGRMSNKVTFRCTPEDLTALILQADEAGMDTSSFIRHVLFQTGVIVP